MLKLDNATPETRRLFRAAELTGALHCTVSALFALYDTPVPGGGPDSAQFLNDAQPLSFGKCLSMSLDELACELSGATDDWLQIALDALAADEAAAAPRNQVRARLEGLGFAWEFPGQFERYGDNGAKVGVSNADGCGEPTESDWAVCFYPDNWNGEQIAFDIRSTNSGGDMLSLFPMVTAALAMLAVVDVPPPAA